MKHGAGEAVVEGGTGAEAGGDIRIRAVGELLAEVGGGSGISSTKAYLVEGGIYWIVWV